MNEIVVEADGPLVCSGDIELMAHDDAPLFRTERVALCRCGSAADGVRCDESCKRNGFRDETLTSRAIGDASALEEGTLKIKVRQRGPFKLSGPAIVRVPDGALLYAGTDTVLCRCGLSKERPFCDGSHRVLRDDRR